MYYCLYGEPLNTNKLKSSKFLKLLRDSHILLKGVLKINENASAENINSQNRKTSKAALGITQIEVDLIFKKLTSGTQGRMDFDQFFKALVLIASKIHPDHDPRTSLDLLYNAKLSVIEDQIT
jgi:hypothetical protein